jgi:hypothetical protein
MFRSNASPNRRAQSLSTLRRGHKTTLRLELLEDRCVLSTIWAVTTNNVLLRFDSATPSAIAPSVSIGGLQPGEVIVGIDFRPATGELIGVGVVNTPGNDTGRLYRINPTNGAATQIGSTPFSTTLADGAFYGLDFNPVTGALRLVNSADQNLRLNVFTGGQGAGSPDTNLAFTLADPNVLDNPEVAAVAYDQNFAGTNTTTLFGIDFTNSVLVRQGGVNGLVPPANPSPNGGELTTIGTGLGIVLASRNMGFDIERQLNATDQAFAALTNNATGLTGLYTINLLTGTATLVGNIGNGATQVAGISIAPNGYIAASVASGGAPIVQVFNALTGASAFEVVPYEFTFQGGVRVAIGDVNRDGVPDIITAPGPGRAPTIRVFSGIAGAPLATFDAFRIKHTQGLYVAATDTTGDGRDDIVVGRGEGRPNFVRVFDGLTNAKLLSFQPFGVGIRAGVRVAAADINNDGLGDIIAAGSAEVGGQIKVFNGLTGADLGHNIAAFGPTFAGGVFVAAGDVNADGRFDIVASTDSGSRVKAFNGAVVGQVIAGLQPFAATASVSIRVAVVDTNADGRDDILVAAGPGRSPVIRSFDALTGRVVDKLRPFDPAFLGGLFIGAGS